MYCVCDGLTVRDGEYACPLCPEETETCGKGKQRNQLDEADACLVVCHCRRTSFAERTDTEQQARGEATTLEMRRSHDAQEWALTSEVEEEEGQQPIPARRPRILISSEDVISSTKGELCQGGTTRAPETPSGKKDLVPTECLLAAGKDSASSPPTSSPVPPPPSMPAHPSVSQRKSLVPMAPSPCLVASQEVSRKLGALCAGQQATIDAIADLRSVVCSTIAQCFDRLDALLTDQHREVTCLLSSLAATMAFPQTPHSSPSVSIISPACSIKGHLFSRSVEEMQEPQIYVSTTVMEDAEVQVVKVGEYSDKEEELGSSTSKGSREVP
ncbi:hypothetical protein NDU88_008067 [Pleurodeles waltl]|uniref:Uncharacterized protein n=1 Tax=Pleurodeles waltl TaxID=8319 RepID=A0AAV7N7Q4_PLEWA|nr:hypothetical protein NDU88_008067 [Pleurodeles waltl]